MVMKWVKGGPVSYRLQTHCFGVHRFNGRIMSQFPHSGTGNYLIFLNFVIIMVVIVQFTRYLLFKVTNEFEGSELRCGCIN